MKLISLGEGILRQNPVYHALKRSPAKKKNKSSGRRSKSPRTKRSRSPHHATVKVKQVSEGASALDRKFTARAGADEGLHLCVSVCPCAGSGLSKKNWLCVCGCFTRVFTFGGNDWFDSDNSLSEILQRDVHFRFSQW